MAASAPDADFELAIRTEGNRALAVGGRLASILAVVSTGLTSALALRDPAFWPAVSFPVACTIGATLTWRMAARERVHGPAAWVLFVLFAMLPTATLLTFEAFLPWGAATFFFGPIAIGWLVIIVLTGFTFDARLSMVVSLIAAGSYFVVYAYARRHLELLAETTTDATFRADLLGWEVQLLRSALFIGVGVLIGGLSTLARVLLRRVRDEVTEREAVSRLFGQYVSPEVQEKLVRERAHLTGERKVVAVLFSDLRGFTTLSEGRAPKEVVELLNRYFDRMVGAISKHGGTVDKFIGDAVMATFGGLLPVENPAAAALDAALEMRRELKALNAELPGLDNGIGVHFGEVLQGPIGSAERKEFTVIGDVVNTASRLESATKELKAHVVLSDALVNALPEARRAELVKLGDVMLKGKEKPVTTWAPTSERQ
ncbi:MAG: adenylate/guanylate cyclase domain-containing protein [Archangium sp.]|nr:adenylate/guanylate cyclase domain-containing protein [Archangium sp.]